MQKTWIRQYDLFPKIDKELTEQSGSGGFLSVSIMTILTYLLLSEFIHWRTTQYKYEFLVDQAVQQTLNVNVDITVKMKCEYVRMDVLDVAGDSLHISTIIPQPVAFHTSGAVDFSSVQAKNVKNTNGPIQGRHDNNARYYGDLDACRFFGSFDVTKVEGSLHITALGYGYFGLPAPRGGIS
jgi:endoplasmic reticulum-Golgi intermediate compartment protein 2